MDIEINKKVDDEKKKKDALNLADEILKSR